MLWILSGHDTFGALDANNQYCSKASFWNNFQTCKARIILCPSISKRLNVIGKIFMWLLLGFPSQSQNELSLHALLLDDVLYKKRKSEDFLKPENFFQTCLGPQVYGKAPRWPGFRWNWPNCYGVHASVAQFLHDFCDEYHIHLFFWFVGNNYYNGRKKRPQYTQAARLNQRASTKEENSNTCGATKEKVGHWVWMKICPQTCARVLLIGRMRLTS